MTRGLLLIGHGTRDDEGTRQFLELARTLAELAGPTPVEPALLEFQNPTIDQAWMKLVDRGVTHIDVAPLLLFAAGHAKQDIPEIIAGLQTRSPQVRWSQSRPLSRQRTLVELALERASEALLGCQSPPKQCAFVLVGRGSFDPCAQADTRVLAELIGHRLQVAATATAFYAMASPDVPSVLDQVASLGVRNVVVQPHLLFEGSLHQAVLRQAREAADRHRNIQFRVSRYLGPDPRVAEAILARATQASAAFSFHP